MKKLSFLALCCCTILMLQCKPSGPDANMLAADKDAIRNADMDWSNSAKDIDQLMAAFLDDAHVLASNEPIASGKEAIRSTFAPMYDLPGFSVKWEPNTVEIANSGELGYTIGAYKLTVNDSTGMPMVDTGKYLTVWKKQADGRWKVAADMFNSDLPAH